MVARGRRVRYPLARRLLITADGGGSNGSRVRLWKLELQRLADELAISIEVHHLPPGTSKWNKIEHRLFSFITQNWRAKPLVSYRVIVDLIAATTTQTGLKVLCELDDKSYPKGIVVSNEEMASLNIKRADFHGEWNYTIAPSNQSREAVVSFWLGISRTPGANGVRASSATTPRLPDADRRMTAGQTRDLPASGTILLCVMRSLTPAG